MKWTIFAKNKQTGEELVWCQTNDASLAKEIFHGVSNGKPDLFQYRLSDKPYTPKRIGLEGKDGRWV